MHFCSAKVPYNFSAKNIVAVHFVSTVRLNESSSNDFALKANDALNMFRIQMLAGVLLSSRNSGALS